MKTKKSQKQTDQDDEQRFKEELLGATDEKNQIQDGQDDELRLKEELLGAIDKKKYKYLLLTRPLEEGYVAKVYCSECGGGGDITRESYEEYMKIAGVPMDAKDFYPLYYIEIEGCHLCRDKDNPPTHFTIRKLES